MCETFNPLPHRPKMETQARAPSTKEVSMARWCDSRVRAELL